MSSEMSVSQINGKEIYLPDGRLLGVVGETVIDGNQLCATHLFVLDVQMNWLRKGSTLLSLAMG
ncbi:MAG: hypothetical protein CM15mP71_3960 [Candidatus Poseidoniales archaeon]|nr:MAG: hypothetical protein CM15mP71_3960 [Candidatus Poseidoniales archaeon]